MMFINWHEKLKARVGNVRLEHQSSDQIKLLNILACESQTFVVFNKKPGWAPIKGFKLIETKDIQHQNFFDYLNSMFVTFVIMISDVYGVWF